MQLLNLQVLDIHSTAAARSIDSLAKLQAHNPKLNIIIDSTYSPLFQRTRGVVVVSALTGRHRLFLLVTVSKITAI
jgi:hypothetical protein